MENVEKFSGINGSPLRVIGIFNGEVEIENVRVNLKFYIVPDDTMRYDALLGRDFLMYPSLQVTLSKNVEIVKVEETREEDRIMHIEYVQPYNVRDELHIYPVIARQDDKEIRKAYKEQYVENLKAEPCVPEYEMNIVLKTNNR